MAQQIPLNIKLRDDATFDNFYPGENEQLLFALKERQELYLYISGIQGTGKTHLLQAVCHEMGSQGEPLAYLPLSEEEIVPEMLNGLEMLSHIMLDDIQHVAGDEKWEIAIFNLYNKVRETGSRLIVSADRPVLSLDIQLPDLHSRLTWGPVFQLKGLNETEKLKALQLRAHKRGLFLADEVAGYILKRLPRDMTSLFQFLDKLDKASMVEKRKLTIPFVKDYLC